MSTNKTTTVQGPALLIKFDCEPGEPLVYLLANDLDEENQLREIAGVVNDALRAWSAREAA